MNKLKIAFISIIAILGVVTLAPNYAYAAPADEVQKGLNAVGDSNAPTLGSQIQNVVNLMLFVLGAIAVIMIVIGGIRYTTSNGEASSLKAAKDTILYSVVGLVVALMAYAIVTFVLNSFK